MQCLWPTFQEQRVRCGELFDSLQTLAWVSRCTKWRPVYSGSQRSRRLVLRVLPFDVVAVGGRRVGRGLCFRRLFCRPKVAGAVMASILNVVVFGQGWDQRSASADLTDAAQNDFGASLIEFDGAVNLNRAAREPSDVADILQIGREDNDRKGASHLILAEVEEVNAFRANFNAQHSSGDTLGLADVVVGLVDRNAITRGEQWRLNHDHQQ